MLARAQNIKTLDNLRDFVNKTLCLQHQLLLGAFRMTEHPLLRGGKPCGILFCLHGPRAVKFTAVWETEHNTVLFYGATGERIHRIPLLEPVEQVVEEETAGIG
jgi:hypothetical protein